MSVEEMTTLSVSDVIKPPYIDNPYPLYHAIRALSPVYWDERANSWVLTSHAEVMTALRDPRFSADRIGMDVSWLPEEVRERLKRPVRAMAKQILFLDPPDHTRLRSLATKAFTPRMVERMREHIQQIVDDLLDAVEAKGEMEVIRDLSYPLPAIVIAETMGVPPEDRDRFSKWTADFGALLDGVQQSMQEVVMAFFSVIELMDYFADVIAQRRGAPKKDDLLQAMIGAEEHGDTLDEDELLGNCVLLLAAGHLTTTHLIGNGLWTLLKHPEQLQALRDDPALASGAVLEVLRYESPVQATARKTKVELEIGGQRIPEGVEVLVCLGAANRDPAQFPNPDQFDLRRADSRHMAFGHGPHFCLGAPLARLEAQIAFNTVARRFPNLHLLNEQPAWETSYIFRGQRELHLGL